MAQNQPYQNQHGYVDAAFLKAAADLSKERKQQVYRLIHIQPGQHILDVGCGSGTDTIPLAHFVGPAGKVIGLDQDPAMLAEADKRAAAEGVTDWVEHRVGDALALPFAANHFDACHSERMFLHLLQPAQAFAEIVRVTKPGGWIAISEPDGASISVDSPEVEVERQLAQAWVRFHNNSYAGRQIYALFKHHQLEDVSVTILPFMFPNLAMYRRLFRFDEVASKALEAGIVRQEELQRFETSLEAAERIGAFFGYFNIITVVGRKPD